MGQCPHGTWAWGPIGQCHPPGQCTHLCPTPQHMGLEHHRVMPPPSKGTWPSAGTPTCEAEAEGAVGSAVAVAHLTGQQPPSSLAHTQQPQAVLVVVWHHHLTRALQFSQNLPTPAGTPAVTSQLHRQTHCPIDRFCPTAP